MSKPSSRFVVPRVRPVRALDGVGGVAVFANSNRLLDYCIQVNNLAIPQQIVDLRFTRAVRGHQPLQCCRLVGRIVIPVSSRMPSDLSLQFASVPRTP